MLDTGYWIKSLLLHPVFGMQYPASVICTLHVVRDSRVPLLHIIPMPDANPYLTLAAALRERLAVIADHEARAKDPAAHLERLKAASEKIVALQSQLPPDISPRLTHFLEGCSYDKALAFIEEHERVDEKHT
jgi:hypothetical protein